MKKLHYYKVTDYEGYSYYYTVKSMAVRDAKRWHKESVDFGYGNHQVSLCQFDLPKMPLRKLVICLLNQTAFMANPVYIDFLTEIE